MKKTVRDIFPFNENTFFSPIRDKVDYAGLIINSARVLLLNIDSGSHKANCFFKLVVDKMSRLFFYKDGKYFSVSFPFNVILEGDEVLEIATYSGVKVDNKIISSVISVLNNTQFRLKPSPIDFWVDADVMDVPGLSLLEEIFLFEPSYIRYDYDPRNVKGKLHPLNHLDINYSAYGTYKIGLNNIIKGEYFENILNISTDCAFISD